LLSVLPLEFSLFVLDHGDARLTQVVCFSLLVLSRGVDVLFGVDILLNSLFFKLFGRKAALRRILPQFIVLDPRLHWFYMQERLRRITDLFLFLNNFRMLPQTGGVSSEVKGGRAEVGVDDGRLGVLHLDAFEDLLFFDVDLAQDLLQVADFHLVRGRLACVVGDAGGQVVRVAGGELGMGLNAGRLVLGQGVRALVGTQGQGLGGVASGSL